VDAVNSISGNPTVPGTGDNHVSQVLRRKGYIVSATNLWAVAHQGMHKLSFFKRMRQRAPLARLMETIIHPERFAERPIWATIMQFIS
jgi:hypothetical protein